ncbi:MAG TPA: hypothetical protein VGG39_20605 [Polyangiaceae bacterium]|jgi:hypothetical protein
MSDPRDRIDDPDAPPSEEERAAAESLRAALEDPARPNEDAALARALSSAWSPRDLAAETHHALVAKALDARSRRRGVVVRVSFGASAALALAAAVLLLVRSDRQPPDTVHAIAAIAVSRSTQPLFPDRFPATGGETARIDRIAMARATDLRDNEFAKWGVR